MGPLELINRLLSRSLNPEHPDALIRLMDKSTSQLGQDLFVLATLDYKRNGYFVEIGAADGVFLSNTLLLETDFAWTGILAEPAPRWHTVLGLDRRSAKIDRRCVWSESNQVVDLVQPEDAAFSTVRQFADSDHHAELREGGELVEVETVSLVDLLKFHGAPTDIEYLSIDTEGSEHEILQAFDFDTYRFRVITCEHNYTPARQKIFDLLTSHGYKRVHEDVSEWDDWYVRA